MEAVLNDDIGRFQRVSKSPLPDSDRPLPYHQRAACCGPVPAACKPCKPQLLAPTVPARRQVVLRSTASSALPCDAASCSRGLPSMTARITIARAEWRVGAGWGGSAISAAGGPAPPRGRENPSCADSSPELRSDWFPDRSPAAINRQCGSSSIGSRSAQSRASRPSGDMAQAIPGARRPRAV
jgi:hypothetical protein